MKNNVEMTRENEIWMDIPDYEGLYQVSNLGRVKSLERTIIFKDGRKQTYPERIKKPTNNGRGYLIVKLYQNNKEKGFSVHQLVAGVFIPNDNPIEKTEINHKDENPLNNHVDNLEWCNHTYNINYGTCKEKVSETLKGRKLSEGHKRNIGKGNKGKKHTEETKQKMSEKMKGKFKGENHPMYGKQHTEETKHKMSEAKKGHIAPNRKPILQFSLEGVFIREWESVRQVEKELNINKGNITSCCRKKRNKCGGFIWRYKETII